jgi:predicted phosphodiesterase
MKGHPHPFRRGGGGRGWTAFSPSLRTMTMTLGLLALLTGALVVLRGSGLGGLWADEATRLARGALRTCGVASGPHLVSTGPFSAVASVEVSFCAEDGVVMEVTGSAWEDDASAAGAGGAGGGPPGGGSAGGGGGAATVMRKESARGIARTLPARRTSVAADGTALFTVALTGLSDRARYELVAVVWKDGKPLTSSSAFAWRQRGPGKEAARRAPPPPSVPNDGEGMRTLGMLGGPALPPPGNGGPMAAGFRPPAHVAPLVRIGFISDPQSGAATFRALLARLGSVQPPVEALIHGGDGTQDPGSDREGHVYFLGPLDGFQRQRQAAAPKTRAGGGGESGGSAGPGVQLVLVRGNHDSPTRLRDLTGGKTRSVLQMGSVRIIVLDSEDPGRDQLSWLERVCDGDHFDVRSLPDAAFTIAVVHIAPFIEWWEPKVWEEGPPQATQAGEGSGGGAAAEKGKTKRSTTKGGAAAAAAAAAAAPAPAPEKEWNAWVREKALPILMRPSCGVDLILSGHSHIYQRGQRRDGRGGPVVVVAGGGGGALEEESTGSARVEDWDMFDVTRHAHHFGVLTVGTVADVAAAAPGAARLLSGQRCAAAGEEGEPQAPLGSGDGGIGVLAWEAFGLDGGLIDAVALRQHSDKARLRPPAVNGCGEGKGPFDGGA